MNYLLGSRHFSKALRWVPGEKQKDVILILENIYGSVIC
jgi:hypothetical protein